jgi:hypothetical protein
MLLNLLFRIGIAQRAPLKIDRRADSSEQIFLFMEKQGGSLGCAQESDRSREGCDE